MCPLQGLKVIEMAGLAPAPYCGMLLADFGADVLIVNRLTEGSKNINDSIIQTPLDRGKRSIRINLKSRVGVEIVKKMILDYDILIEPYRPGVMERLGLGPDDALKINPRLIYARLTGWGQDGPYAKEAGHDINFIALSGALSLFRRRNEKPLPPCNILADFAGGGLFCAFGILLALIERHKSGCGQVIDVAMIDGAAHLITLFYGLLANKKMTLNIGTNMLDGGAPYYQTYKTADKKFIAVGAIEPKFYKNLLKGLGIDHSLLQYQNDIHKWPEIRKDFEKIFITKTREEWCTIFSGKDACVTPILNLDEVGEHKHNRKRNLLVNINGMSQPAPTPRFSRSQGKAVKPSCPKGYNTSEILTELGFTENQINNYLKKEIVESFSSNGRSMSKY